MTTLYLDDCLEKMKNISSNSIDLVICDLPFGCLHTQPTNETDFKKYRGGQVAGGTLGCAWDIKIDLDKFWKEIKRIRKNEHTPCLMFCTTKYGYEKEFRYDLVWSKTNAVGFLSANKKPMSSHEMVYVFSKAGANYNRIDLEGDYKKAGGGRSSMNVYIANVETIQPNNEGKRCIKSVIEIANKKTKRGHPTQKPIELYKFLIERYSNKNDLVLDPTFGSGNSGLACIELKRRYIGIEKDNNFFWKFVKRCNE